MRAVTFHNVVAEPLDLFDRELWRMPVSRFRRAIDMLRQRYRIVSLPDALAALDAEDSAASNALTITFDDGFANVFDIAFPILAEAGVVATTFVLTEPGRPAAASRLLHFEQLEIAFRLTEASVIDARSLDLPMLALSSEREKLTALLAIKRVLKRLAEPEQTRELARIFAGLGVAQADVAAFAAQFPKYRKLSAQQLCALADAGWTIGGHTRTHRPLSSLSSVELRAEIGGNFNDLKAVLAQPQVPFAYPYGSPELIGAGAVNAVLESGFSCAFTTSPGENGSDTDRFQLKRFSDMAIMVDLTLAGIPMAAAS